jgi:hypothetical protein
MTKYKTIEARQSVDYITGICEKCFKKGLFSEDYPKEEVEEIVKSIADELEFSKLQ